MKTTDKPYLEKKVIYLLSFLISLLSLYFFIKSGHTVYDWPSIDIVPTIKRYYNEEYLKYDYVTNANTDKNPRDFFVYIIIFFSKLFNDNWYLILFSFKLLIVLMLPVSYFILIYSFVWERLQSSLAFNIIIFSIFFFVAYLIYNPVFLSIAWWKIIDLQVKPESFAILLSFIYYSLRNFYCKNEFLKILIVISCLIHGPVSLLIAIFYLINNFKKNKIKEHLANFAVIAIVGVLLTLYYKSNTPLSNAEFSFYYARACHPFHYSLFHFGSFSYPWYYNFIFCNIVFLVGIIYGISRDKIFMKESLIIFVPYLLLIFIGHFFTAIVPFKPLVSIGVSRFYMFSGLLIFILIIKFTILHLIKLSKKNLAFKSCVLRYITLRNIITLYLLVASIFFIKYYNNPNPFEIKNDLMLTWIKKNTNKNSVFATPSKSVDISIKAERSTFASNIFCFNEAYFKGYYERHCLLFGTIEQQDSLIFSESLSEKSPQDFFYHIKSPENFINLANKYRLDYIILKNEYINKEFKKYKSEFKDNEHSIYSLKSLVTWN